MGDFNAKNPQQGLCIYGEDRYNNNSIDEIF